MIKVTKEFANEVDDFNQEEKSQLIENIVRDNPQTTLAATRIKKIIQKTGLQVSDSLKNILVDIVSETAKNIIWSE